MLRKALPACACVSVLNKLTVPTTLGTVVMLLLKIPKVIKTAEEIKKNIPAAQQFINNIKQQNQMSTEEVTTDMG